MMTDGTMMRDNGRWVGVLAAALAVAMAGCMEESPELMMGQGGNAPPPPGQGQNQAAPQAGPPAGQPGGGVSGEPVPGPSPGVVDAEDQGAPQAPATSSGAATGTAGGDEGGDASGAGNAAATTGQGGPDTGGNRTAGAGPPPPQPDRAGADGSEKGLLARLFSSQDSSSAPAGTAMVQPASAGSPGLPRVLESVEDKPLYALSDLEVSPETVRLKGTISCSVCRGKILLNVVSSKGLVVSAPGLSPGDFDIPVPRGIGDVTVTAIGDDNADGVPTQGEPLGGYMNNPVKIGDEDIGDLVIEIGKSPPPPAVETQ